MPRKKTLLQSETLTESLPSKGKISVRKKSVPKKTEPALTTPPVQRRASSRALKISSTPVAPVSPPNSSAPTPIFSQSQTPPPKHTMTSTECFIYGGIVCLVGTIGLGLLLGLVVLPPIVAQYERTQYSYANTLNASDPAALQLPTTGVQTDTSVDVPEYGFYGTLLSREENVLMVQELLPPLPLEEPSSQTPQQTRTYAVRVDDATEYTYQRPRDEKNLTDTLFSPESGSVENIAPSMYIFINTPDDPEKTETVRASHILYSEKSPFAE